MENARTRRRKQIYVQLVLLIGCMLLLSACSIGNGKEVSSPDSTTSGEAASSEEAYHKITAEKAKEMIDEGGVTVVDVRTAEEYTEKRIPGAVLVPVETIGGELPEALPDKDAVLLVHCRTGVRSKRASGKLVKLGYTQVYDFGGIVDWPYETESGQAR